MYWSNNEGNEGWTREKLKEACLRVLKLEWSKLKMKKRNKLKEDCFEAWMKLKCLDVFKTEWTKWNEQRKRFNVLKQ